MTSILSKAIPIWLTDADVAKSISLNEVIDALETGLLSEASSQASNLEKALGQFEPSSSLHALGSMMPGRGYVGFKTWANTPEGASAIFSLFSAKNGSLLALMEAGMLGKLRTAAISGLATRVLAAPDADELALVGTGAQALMQIAAVAAVRRLKRVRVFSPTLERREDFVRQAGDLFPFAIEAFHSLEDAVRGAPIVTLITRAREPFFHASLVAKGAHINAAGAILPTHAEFFNDLFERSDLVVVDSPDNARKASREMREHFGTDVESWSGIKSLGEVLLAGDGRPQDADLTLFKPMGMGLSDLSVAAPVFERSRDAHHGVPMPFGAPASARWTVAG